MRKLDHDLRRREIAEAAARLIAAGGMEALSTRKLAQSLGCSIGGLSHYFEDKSAIVMAAFSWANTRIEARLYKSLEGDFSISMLLPLIGATLPHDRQSRTEWSVRLNLWCHAASDHAAAAMLRRDTRRHQEIIRGVLVQLQRRGEIRTGIDTDAVALTLIDLIHGMGYAALLGLHQSRHSPAAAFAAVIDQLRAEPALSAPPASAPGSTRAGQRKARSRKS